MKATQNLFIFCLLIIAINNPLHAQITWVGGAAGQETNWNEPSNWSENRVPDLYDHVRVERPASGHLPVVDTDTRPVATLLIEEGAEVLIAATGTLVIDNPEGYAYGIFLVGGLINEGTLMINANTSIPVRGNTKLLRNKGLIAFLGTFEAEELAGR